MRIARLIISIIFIVALVGVLVLHFTGFKKEDETLPEFTVASDSIETTIADGETAFLNGVEAYDEKDGSLTGDIYIDSKSDIDKEGNFTVTLAVCDADGHVVKHDRSVHYTDYESPSITINRELRFSNRETFNILDCLTATDVIDGDISDQIEMVKTDITARTAGDYTVTVKVENSLGDVTKFTCPVYIETYSALRPEFHLNAFVDTYEAGSAAPDWKKYIDSVYDVVSDIDIDINSVVVDASDVDLSTPGVYSVIYMVTPENQISTDSNTSQASVLIIVK